MISKQSRNPVNFTPAINIKPYSVLLDWLNNNFTADSTLRKLLRLPVVIRFEDAYKLAIGDTFIGVSEEDRNQDSIFLDVNDSTMGISLLSQLNHLCPKTHNSCVVWLEGYWGSLVNIEKIPLNLDHDNQKDIKKWPFTARRVHKLFEKSDLGEEVKVFIESP